MVALLRCFRKSICGASKICERMFWLRRLFLQGLNSGSRFCCRSGFSIRLTSVTRARFRRCGVCRGGCSKTVAARTSGAGDDRFLAFACTFQAAHRDFADGWTEMSVTGDIRVNCGANAGKNDALDEAELVTTRYATSVKITSTPGNHAPVVASVAAAGSAAFRWLVTAIVAIRRYILGLGPLCFRNGPRCGLASPSFFSYSRPSTLDYFNFKSSQKFP